MTKRKDKHPTHIIETPFAKIRAPKGTEAGKPEKPKPSPSPSEPERA